MTETDTSRSWPDVAGELGNALGGLILGLQAAVVIPGLLPCVLLAVLIVLPFLVAGAVLAARWAPCASRPPPCAGTGRTPPDRPACRPDRRARRPLARAVGQDARHERLRIPTTSRTTTRAPTSRASSGR